MNDKQLVALMSAVIFAGGLQDSGSQQLGAMQTVSVEDAVRKAKELVTETLKTWPVEWP